MLKFNKNVQKALGFYVYALIDPFSEQIFYVGKASSNNRAFDHLKSSSSETEKNIKINEIRQKNREPIVEILRYGLKSEAIAFEVEASIIDTIGVDNLTNIIRGHHIENGRLSLTEIERLYGSEPIIVEDILEKYMLFFINQTYSTTLEQIEIYDATRQFWFNISDKKRTKNSEGEYDYSIALSIYDSVVIRVYSIVQWFPAGTTYSTRISKDPTNRWEFVGNLIENHPILGKKLIKQDGNNITTNQQGYGYIN